MDKTKLSDRELLIRIDERVEQLIEWKKSHQSSHKWINGLSISTLVSALATSIFLLIKKFTP